MIRKTVYLLFSLLLCACNQEHTMIQDPDNTQHVSVEMRFSAEDMPEITRATDESAIRDLNLYLFNAATGATVHVYKPSAECSFDCPPGQYTLYAVANMHRNLGKQTIAQIKTLKASYSDSYTDLPMTGTAQLEIPVPRNGATVKLPAVVMRRSVAKIAYNVSVDPEVSNLKLVSVQTCSVVSEYPLFDGTVAKYGKGAIIHIPATSSANYSGIMYVPENLRGTVSTITHERQKDAQHAPYNATYLLIRAKKGSRILDYRVYLGENNTTDFNVNRNSRQTLNIVIKGIKQVDTRYNSYIVSVTDNLDNFSLDKYCIPRATLPWAIAVTIDRTRNDGLLFRGAFQLTAGSAKDLTINNTTGGFYTFNPQTGTTKLDAKYAPSVITQAAPYLKYRVSVADEYGYSQDINIERLCANNITVYRENGTITAAEALFSTDYDPLFRALCYEEGCTLTAKPATGYTFGGWYADENYTQPISTAATYKYVPQNTYNRIYAYFEKTQGNITIYTDPRFVKFTSDLGSTFDADLEAFIVPYGSNCSLTINYCTPLFKGWYDKMIGEGNQLSTSQVYTFTATDNRTVAPAFIPVTNLSAEGTANCYIARTRNAGYTFDARTQGNGKATTGITPQTLGGTTARVLWETGRIQGRVITAAEYIGGAICFRTGAISGNALVGLFDTAGKCVWAWHIWATDYDPAASAQTYAGGRVFMDRNVGALSATVTDPSFRGLYYQWGRPAPFVYPASTSSTARATTIYASDYPYAQYDPLQGNAMTLQNALTHPWIYMLGYYPSHFDRDEDYADWLKPQNPNLWGNASSVSRYSPASAKSIYDPCPPGWKVPDPAAFTNAGFTRSSTSPKNCYYLKSSNGITAVYPMNGHFAGSTFLDNGAEASVWSNAPAQVNNLCLSTSAALWITSFTLNPITAAKRDLARPVRCVRE